MALVETARLYLGYEGNLREKVIGSGRSIIDGWVGHTYLLGGKNPHCVVVLGNMTLCS